MSTELNQLLEPTGFIELTDTQMAAIGGGSKKKKGSTIIVNNNPIVVIGDCGTTPILNFPTIIAN